MAEKDSRLKNLQPFKPIGDKPLSKSQLQIRVDQDVYDKVMSLPKQKRLTLLRQWIKAGVESLEQENA
ncbi:MAG: hypothetical protein QNJ54_28245 [Prochloraceae cyanobacterium]|nr:hypothetical protein [Prochloraceae cyanobacterium]